MGIANDRGCRRAIPGQPRRGDPPDRRGRRPGRRHWRDRRRRLRAACVLCRAGRRASRRRNGNRGGDRTNRAGAGARPSAPRSVCHGRALLSRAWLSGGKPTCVCSEKRCGDGGGPDEQTAMKIALLVCALLASAQQPAGDEGQLRDIQQALARAWVAGDRAYIERVVAPEWTSIQPDGSVLTRATMLATYLGGPVKM